MGNTHEFPRADTPELSEGLYEAVSGSPVTAEAFLEELAQKLSSKVAGGDGSGGPPKKEFLGLTGGGWTKLVVGILLAAAMTAGTWVLLVRDTLKEHSDKIDSHEAADMHPAAAKQIRSIDARVYGVENAVKKINETQQEVVSGLDELKQENLAKIKDENRELKAENKRLERARLLGR